MPKPKWYRCEPVEMARRILLEGYRSKDGRIWVSRNEPMPMYGEVCFLVTLPRGSEETYHDDEGYPVRYAFKYPGNAIPPKNFKVVIGKELL